MTGRHSPVTVIRRKTKGRVGHPGGKVTQHAVRIDVVSIDGGCSEIPHHLWMAIDDVVGLARILVTAGR